MGKTTKTNAADVKVGDVVKYNGVCHTVRGVLSRRVRRPALEKHFGRRITIRVDAGFIPLAEIDSICVVR
jgi:riboflavin synthase alpha subunit